MTLLTLCTSILALTLPAVFGSTTLIPRADDGANAACQLLKAQFPQLTSFPGDEQYVNDTEHWAVSSEQNSTCSIEPTSAEDASAIIQIIGRSDIRAPFAVKSGGHAYNLNASSTPGVQISMAQFTNVSYDAERGTVILGVALTWDQVYEQLEPLGVMVVGGRINGVGVGGFSLGGGFSWKTNQFGLLTDTLVSVETVLPSGEIVQATNSSESDLFFGLKGGLNQFGIVTQLTVEAHPQGLVFGGFLTYSIETNDEFNSAIADFSQNNTDPKAQMVVVYTSNGTQFQNQILLSYDGPTPPSGVFDRVLSIPAVTSDVKTRTFIDMMSTFGDGDNGIGPFGFAQHVVPIVHYTVPILEEMTIQVNAFASRLSAENNGEPMLVSISPEPFFSSFAHSRGGAYPHPPDRQVNPSSASIAWKEDPGTPLTDKIARQAHFVSELRNFTSLIQAKAIEEGQSLLDDILYPNYALTDSPLELVYGENVPRLRNIAAHYDPENVMGLTGGFRRFQDQSRNLMNVD
ncbi:hypothetical protein ACEPAG_2374 [Sanghuangporus baumii]